MEALIRFGVFLGMLLIMVCWEFWRPTRQPSLSRQQRWPVNLGLSALNTVLLRFSIGSLAWLAALWAHDHQWGLFNQLRVSEEQAMVLSLFILDLGVYAQHVATHRYSWLWRLHQVHHCDLDFDTTTAVRFHPLEIVLSMVYKILLIIALGVPSTAVIAFELILSSCALFNHGNVSLPPQWEKFFRYLIITPDLHRIHHSSVQQETDSNYGFSISCWDRIFKTYRNLASMPPAAMEIGLQNYRDNRELGFMQLLMLPFRGIRER